MRQHEELGYRHAKGRIAKYLEIPFQQNQVKALEIMQREIKRRLTNASFEVAEWIGTNVTSCSFDTTGVTGNVFISTNAIKSRHSSYGK